MSIVVEMLECPNRSLTSCIVKLASKHKLACVCLNPCKLIALSPLFSAIFLFQPLIVPLLKCPPCSLAKTRLLRGLPKQMIRLACSPLSKNGHRYIIQQDRSITIRLLFVVFGLPTVACPYLSSVNVLFMETGWLAKSTSDHSKAISSPIRIPEKANRRNKVYFIIPASLAPLKNVSSSSLVQNLNFPLTKVGLYLENSIVQPIKKHKAFVRLI